MVSAAEFIRGTAADPWRWGVNDCALWSASYVAAATGRDPAAALRGTYGSAFACRQVLLRSGGLLALSRALMAGHAAGGAGDGVCVARVAGRQLAGIMSDDRLFLKSDGGVVSPSEFEILEQWKI